MARQLNKNVVVALTLVVFVAAIALSAVMLRRMQQRDPQHFVQLAEQYAQRQDWRQAALFYYKAWERSDDPEHLVFYGKMALAEGDLGAAVGAWQKARTKNPELVSAHRNLLQLLLDLARLEGSVPNWRTVQETAERYLKLDAASRSSGEDAYALHALGLALLSIEGVREGPGMQEALDALSKAAAAAPEEPEYAIDLASALSRAGRADEAAAIFQELMTRFDSPGPQAAKVRVACARSLAGPKRREFDQAESLFQEAIRLSEADADALRDAKLAYAGFLTQQWARAVQDGRAASGENQFRDAERLLKECVEAEEDSFDAFVQLATLYSAAGQHAKVVEISEARLARPFMRKGLEATKNRVGAFNLSVLSSDACVALAVADGQTTENREKWLARADQFVAQAKGEFPTHPRVASQSGKVKAARGQDRAALEDLRDADKGYRAHGTIDWQSKILLARMHVKLGEPGAARTVLEDVAEYARVQRSGDAAFWVLYGQTLLLTDDADRALAMAERVLGFDPDNTEAKQLKAAVLERKGRLAEAGELIESTTGSGVVRTLLAFRELDRAGKTEEALAQLGEALRKSPAEARLVIAAVVRLMELGRHAEAEAIARQALAVSPADPTLKKIEALARPGLTPQQRDEALKQAIEAEPDAFQRAVQLAALAVRQNDLAEAVRRLDEAEQHLLRKDTPLARQATSSVHRDILLQKMRVAGEAKNEPAMLAARDAAAEYDVDGAEGKSLLGVYHLIRGEFEPAVTALRAAVDAQPTDSESLAYLGHALTVLGKYDDARGYFERAVRANPNAFLAHRGLATLAQQRGDGDAYDSELAICTRLAPNDPWVQAELLAQKETAEPLAAITRREAILARQPADPENLRRLAGLCEKVNDLSKADRYFGRLLEIRPDDEAVVLSVAKYYRRTKRPDRALETLSRYAQTRTSAEAQANAQILIAGHNLNQNDRQRAESTLLAAADTSPTLEVMQSLGEFYARSGDRPQDALKWYDEAIAAAQKSQSNRLPTLMSGRIVCLLNPRINDIDAARRTVDELRRLYPEDLSGLYWDSEVHARQGDIEKAVETLSRYLEKSPDDASALLQRAKMRLSLGRSAQAVSDLELIRRTQPMALDLEPRILLAEIHARSGREDAAILELELLVKDAPQSIRASEELIRAYLRAKRLADAERAATSQINRLRDNPDPRWFFIRARALLEMGNTSGALADAQRAWGISGASPEGFWNVLDLYRRAGRFSEGVEFYRANAASGAVPPQAQSLAALLMARSGKNGDAVDQFRKAMDTAMHESLAAVRGVAGDLANAMPLDTALSLFEAPPADGRLARANDRLLSHLYRWGKRIEDAAQRLNSLIGSAKDDTERAGLWYDLGEMLQLAGDTQKSRAAYEECLKYDPRSWTALNNLAYLLSDQPGQQEAALSFARQAVSIMDTPDTVDTLGWVLVAMADYPRAIAELSRAVRLAPTQPLALYHLGEAYRRAGRFLEAQDVLQRAVDAAKSAGDAENERLATEAMDKARRRDKAV